MHVSLTRTETPFSYPCYVRGKGKFYKTVNVKYTAEEFIVSNFAIDRGLIKENQGVQNG